MSKKSLIKTPRISRSMSLLAVTAGAIVAAFYGLFVAVTPPNASTSEAPDWISATQVSDSSRIEEVIGLYDEITEPVEDATTTFNSPILSRTHFPETLSQLQ